MRLFVLCYWAQEKYSVTQQLMFHSTLTFNKKESRIEFIFSFKTVTLITSHSNFQTVVQLVLCTPIPNTLTV